MKIKQLITRNLGWKILSLVLAMIIWAAIINADDPFETKTFKDIPVYIVNEDAISNENKLYEIDSGSKVTVTVRAPISVLNEMDAEDIYARANFKELSIVNAVYIDVSIAEHSDIYGANVEIVSNEPKVMTLTLEELAEASFRVEAVPVGEVAEGYSLSEISVTPNIIKVTGSTRKIANIGHIVAEIDVTGASESFKTTTVLVAYDNDGNIMDTQKVALEATEVETSAVVYPTKELNIQFVQEGTPEDGYRCTNITYLPNVITITGPKEYLKYVSSTISIPFDVTGLNATAIEEVDMNDWLDRIYPEYNLSVAGDKSTVAVTATVEQLGYRELVLQQSDIEFRGIEAGYEARLKVSDSIRLKIVGTTDIVRTISKEELKFYVDVSEFKEGLHYVNIMVESDSDISVVNSLIAVEILTGNIGLEY